MKSKVDKLDVDKLTTVSVEFKKLSNVVDKKVIKKDVFNDLVKKVNVINISKPIILLNLVN